MSAVFGLCTGVLAAKSNLTTPQSTQKILTDDFKPPQVFENTNVVRTINLEKGYVRETTNVHISNTDTLPQSDYYVPFEYELMAKIGGFDARDKKHAEIPLEVTVAALSDVLDSQGASSKYVASALIFTSCLLTMIAQHNTMSSTSQNLLRRKAPSPCPYPGMFWEH